MYKHQLGRCMSRSQCCTLHKFCLLFDTKLLCKQLRMLDRRQVLRESHIRCRFQSHHHYRLCSLCRSSYMSCRMRGIDYSCKMLHRFCLRGGQSQYCKRSRLRPVKSKFYNLCRSSCMSCLMRDTDYSCKMLHKFCLQGVLC